MSYILIYEIDDYSEMGGGLYNEFFDEIEDAEKRLNELIKNDKIDLKDMRVLEIHQEIKYEPVKYVTKVKRMEK